MLAATESIVPQLEIAEQVHKQRMAVLLGESLSNVNQRLAGDYTLPRMKDIIPTGIPSDLLEQRPDIRIAEREMAAKLQTANSTIAVYKALGGDWKVSNNTENVELAAVN
ncbi:hypothetical protein BCT81_22865 [Vibrio sp. 10N.261.52.A1]|nr:hypothetical protein BCT81_22865 [Vibrio sp. 10N.261.52.A1]